MSCTDCPSMFSGKAGGTARGLIPTLAWLVLICIAGTLAAPLACAQDETWEKLLEEYLFRREMRSFWSKVQETVNLNDEKGLVDLFRKDGRMAEEVYANFEKGLMDTERGEFLDAMKLCSKWLDESRGCKEYATRLEYFTSLSHEQQYDRFDAVVMLVEAWSQVLDVVQAEEAPKAATLTDIEDKLAQAQEAFEKIKDNGNLAWLYRQRAVLYDKLRKFVEAVVAMDKAMDYWVAAEMWKNRLEYSWLVDRRRDLIEAGYDPANPAAKERAESKKNTSTSFAEGSDWVTAQLEIKAEKKLDRFKATSWAGDNPYRWFYAYLRQSDKEATFESWFRPWGRVPHLLRDGRRYFLDYDEDGKGDKQVKVKSKPQFVSIPRDPGDRSSPVYSFAVAIGTNPEVMFGIDLSNIPSKEWTTIRYRGGSYLEGEINGTPILIIDDNDSGRFGDPYLDFSDGFIPNYKGYPLLDALVLGRGGDALPYSQYIRLEDGFYRVEPDNTKLTLRYRKMDIDTGRIVLDFAGKAKLQHLVVGEKTEFLYGFFDLAKAGKEGVEVPVGLYEIATGLISNGKSGTSNQCCLILKGNSKPFNVKKGDTYTLELGRPYSFDFTTHVEDQEFVVDGRSVRVYGRGGELYAKFWDEATVPKVTVRSKSGRVLARNKPMRQAVYEDFAASPDGLLVFFYPLDFRMPKRGKDPYEAKLVLKKHKILNASIESDWK